MKNKLLKSGFAVMAAMIICKLFAFLQEIVVAATLGVSTSADAFNTVFSVQDTLYPALSIGVTQIFFPEYKKRLTIDGEEKADGLANWALVFFGIISSLIAVLVFVFAPQIVKVVAPGLDDAVAANSSYMTRLSSAAFFFTCIAAVISSVLMAHGRLFISQVRGAFTHIPIIIALVFLYKYYGYTALGISIAAAGVMRLIVELPFIHKGYRFSLRQKLEKHEIKSLLAKFPSALISSGVGQFNTLIDRMMASTLPSGSISYLHYGARLITVLREFFGTLFATSSYPQIVEHIAKGEKKQLESLVSRLVRTIWFITIPLSVGAVTYAFPVTKVVYMRGAFTEDKVEITALVFIGYGITLCLSSVRHLLDNVFFGFGDTRTPMFVNVANLVLNIAFNFVFIGWLGVAGLAFATSASTVICFAARILLIKKKMSFGLKKLFFQGGLMAFSSAVSVGASRLLVYLTGIKNSLIICVLAVAVSVPLYFILSKVLKIDVYVDFVKMIKNKFLKKGKKQ